MSYAEHIEYNVGRQNFAIASETASEAIARYPANPPTLTYTHTDVLPTQIWGNQGGCEMRWDSSLKTWGTMKKKKKKNLPRPIDTGS